MKTTVPKNKPQRKPKTAKKPEPTSRNCSPDPEICRITSKYIPGNRPATIMEKRATCIAFFGAQLDANPTVPGDMHAHYKKILVKEMAKLRRKANKSTKTTSRDQPQATC